MWSYGASTVYLGILGSGDISLNKTAEMLALTELTFSCV